MPIFYNKPWYPTIYKHVNASEGITFTKTSVIDKTQLPKLVFNNDYTSYDLLLFVVTNTADNTVLEYLATPEMITEILTYSVSGNRAAFAMVKTGTNNYLTYTYLSNTEFTKLNNRNLVLTDVYSLTCNKTITKTMLYAKQSIAVGNVTVTTQDNIFDYDFLLFSCCSGSYDETMLSNIFINLFNVKQVTDNYSFCFSRYNQTIQSGIIKAHEISAGPFFAVQALKFT